MSCFCKHSHSVRAVNLCRRSLDCLCSHESGTLVQDVEHRVLELIVADQAVPIHVNLGHDLLPDSLVFGSNCSSTEHLLDLFTRDTAVTIGIKESEGLFEIGLGDQLLPIVGRREELRVVDVAVLVSISCLHDPDHVRFIHLEQAHDLGHVLTEFILVEVAVIVRIPLFEHLGQLLESFTLGHEVGQDRDDTRLERSSLRKGGKVCTKVELAGLINLFILSKVTNPAVFQEICNRRTLRNVLLECVFNERFNLVGALVKFFIFGLVVDDIPVYAFLREALCCISVVEGRLAH